MRCANISLNIWSGYGDSWREGRQKRRGALESVASTMNLTTSGLDEGLVPEDGGLNFVGKLIGYGGEEFEEFLLAFLRATTGSLIDDAGVVSIVGDGEVVGSIVREEVDCNLVADVATFGVGDKEHGDGMTLHPIGDAVGLEILFVNVDGSHGILFFVTLQM